MATILTKRSNTASSVPLAADLTNSTSGAELAVNTADKRLFTKDSGGSVVELGTNPSSLALPSGSVNGVPYLNGSKVLTTGSALTFDGTTFANTAGGVNANGAMTVTGATNGYKTLYLSNYADAAANWNYIRSDSGLLNIYATGSNSIGFGASGSEQMRLTSTGLGIGTSSVDAKLVVYGSAGSNPYSHFKDASGADFFIQSVGNSDCRTGTASNHPWLFFTNGSEKMRLDSSGNLGLGVTPSAGASWVNFQTQRVTLSGGANDRLELAYNYYRTSGQDTYIASDVATRYRQISGQHQWFTAPSGTAGNAITFTQAMTLDASGRLGLGTTSPSNLFHVAGSASDPVLISNSNSGAFNSIILRNNSSNRVAVGIGGSSVGGSFQNVGYIGTIENIDFGFQTNNTERARILANGVFCVGTTTQLDFSSSNAQGTMLETNALVGSRSSGAPLYLKRYTSTGEIAYFFYGTSTVGTISTNGSSTAYNTTSDYRLKEAVQPMTGALAKVAALKPCTYKWKADGSDGEGFIAHELQAVVPDCVTGEKDAVDADGNPKYQGIDTSFLVATLTAAIQELKAEFDAYKATHP